MSAKCLRYAGETDRCATVSISDVLFDADCNVLWNIGDVYAVSVYYRLIMLISCTDHFAITVIL